MKNIKDIKEDFFSPELCQLLTTPLRLYFNPKFYGMENIDTKNPHLYVCNHTIYGIIDVPLLVVEVYKQKGFLFCSLGDSRHYKIPIWRDILIKGGMYHGDRKTCAELMKKGKNILVFPGGGYEVFKCKGEAYKLNWRKRYGFVRMAVEYSYPIIPVAQLGIDNAYTILMDSNELLNSFFGKLIKKTGLVDKYLRGGETIPPIARGIGLTPIPRPERLYFSFGKAIKTKKYNKNYKDDDIVENLRKKVEDALINEIKKLLYLREQDSEHGILRSILKRF